MERPHKATEITVKAVLFDFDGVIVDSLDFHLEAWSALIRELVGEDSAPLPPLAGLNTSAIVTTLHKTYGLKLTAAQLTEKKHTYLIQHARQLPFLPGAKESLSFVKKRGIPHAIASSSPRPYVEKSLVASHITPPKVIGAEDVKNLKPSPEAYWEAAKVLGFGNRDFANIVAFDDSVHGVKAIVGAGMLAIGVTSQIPGETLRAAGAAATCSDLMAPFRESWFSLPDFSLT